MADRAAAADWVAGRFAGWGEGRMASWSVRDASSGELLGSAALRGLDHPSAWGVASYWVRAAHRGQGVAPQALTAAARFAFGALGLHRVALFHAMANTASCRVAEKAGYLLEGMLRQSFVYGDGKRYDEHLHARLATDR
ncbi:MAG: GNAT family N-acetyltransferase [Actinomycetes bacterium]